MNGMAQDTLITYHVNGKIKEQGLHKDNVRQGIWKKYYTNGNMESVGEYYDRYDDPETGEIIHLKKWSVEGLLYE